MIKKSFRYIFIIIFILLTSFISFKEIKAEESLTCDTENKMVCEYVLTGKNQKIKLYYVMRDMYLNYSFKCYDLNGNEVDCRSSIMTNFTYGNFFSEGQNIPKCINISYTFNTDGPMGIELFYATVAVQSSANNQSESEEICNTYTKNYEKKLYSCGNYGGLLLYSVRLDETGAYFDYKADYSTSDKNPFFARNLNVRSGHFAIKTPIDENGCPKSVCFKVKKGSTREVTLSADSTDCRNKGAPIPSADDIEENQGGSFFDKWDEIPAILGQAIDMSTNKDITCEGALGEARNYIKTAFIIIRIIAIALLVVLSVLDFMGSVANSDSDSLKKSSNKLVKRIIITVVILILPSIINLIINITLINGGTCGI